MTNLIQISQTDLLTLEGLLQQTNVLFNNDKKSEQELNYIYSLIPKLVPHSRELHYASAITSESNFRVKYYTSTNEKLNKHIKNILKLDTYIPFIISEVNYFTGGFCNPHIDPQSDLTFNIMLEDKFEGGQVYVDGVPTDFSKRGHGLTFEGKSQQHYIGKIISGKRKALSIWMKKK